MFLQLLNRNPKHRLGAQRDAIELKEHAYFKNTDWAALSRKEVTPPFKPVVESDESTNNFDPEFTEADVRGAAVGLDGFEELMVRKEEEVLDEDDPSEKWVERSLGGMQAAMHTPNGPLGSDRVVLGVPLTPHPYASPMSNGAGRSKGIDIKGAAAAKKRKEARGGVGDNDDSPLTSSVQEKFRGFTYHGGESVGVGTIHEAMALRKERLEREKAKEEDDGEVTPNADTVQGDHLEEEQQKQLVTEDGSMGLTRSGSSGIQAGKTKKMTKTVGFWGLDDLDGMDGVS